jgi:hypothetical protein
MTLSRFASPRMSFGNGKRLLSQISIYHYELIYLWNKLTVAGQPQEGLARQISIGITIWMYYQHHHDLVSLRFAK